MQKEKDLDKFYTKPEIAKKFVDLVNQHFPLNDFDMVIEPAAGCGNILQYLPDGSIGMDIEPEREGIVKQDFLNTSHHITHSLIILELQL